MALTLPMKRKDFGMPPSSSINRLPQPRIDPVGSKGCNWNEAKLPSCRFEVPRQSRRRRTRLSNRNSVLHCMSLELAHCCRCRISAQGSLLDAKRTYCWPRGIDVHDRFCWKSRSECPTKRFSRRGSVFWTRTRRVAWPSADAT